MERLSSVAAIVSKKGTVLRIVVEKLHDMQFHVGEGERIFILPDVKVEEPVPWEKIPSLIQLATDYAKQELGK